VPAVSTLAVLGPDGPYLADPTEPIVHAEDLGLLRGEGVFETTRVVSGTAVDLDEHLARLVESARAVDVDLPDSSALRELAARAIRNWDAPHGVLRLVATKGGERVPPVRFALVSALPAGLDALRTGGIEVVTLTLGVTATARASAPWLLGGIKATSYAVAMASQRAAHDRGAVDAIWLSADGEVLEAPTSTVLIARGGALFTPPSAALGLLPGLTLSRLRRISEITERRLTTDDLAAAEEVLLASSVRGVVPVTAVDGRSLSIGRYGAELPAALERHLVEHPA
jgi:4-amino-4-deoxychorismate lyase